MAYLFECMLGPVQDFIAAGRRSHDLWYGSWLLSELSKAAAKAVFDHGGELIFPTPSDMEKDLAASSEFNSPNKVVAISEIPPNELAAIVEQAIGGRRNALREEAFNRIYSNPYFDQGFAQEQIDDLTEFYCVATRIGPSGYVEARRKAEILLRPTKSNNYTS